MVGCHSQISSSFIPQEFGCHFLSRGEGLTGFVQGQAGQVTGWRGSLKWCKAWFEPTRCLSTSTTGLMDLSPRSLTARPAGGAVSAGLQLHCHVHPPVWRLLLPSLTALNHINRLRERSICIPQKVVLSCCGHVECFMPCIRTEKPFVVENKTIFTQFHGHIVTQCYLEFALHFFRCRNIMM